MKLQPFFARLAGCLAKISHLLDAGFGMKDLEEVSCLSESLFTVVSISVRKAQLH